jgi:hypothetical protein
MHMLSQATGDVGHDISDNRVHLAAVTALQEILKE